MKELIKKFEDSYNRLNQEQENFLLYGVLIPCVPVLLLWFFCLFFFSYTFIQLMGDVLLCAYSIVCSALSVYIGLKAKQKPRKLLYFIEIFFIACINVTLNRHDDLKNQFMIYVVYGVIIVILLLTILNVKTILELISNDNNTLMNESKGDSRNAN